MISTSGNAILQLHSTVILHTLFTGTLLLHSIFLIVSYTQHKIKICIDSDYTHKPQSKVFTFHRFLPFSVYFIKCRFFKFLLSTGKLSEHEKSI